MNILLINVLSMLFLFVCVFRNETFVMNFELFC